MLHTPLPENESQEEDGGSDEDTDRLRRAPAPTMALGDAENEHGQPRGHENGTKRVEALAVLVHALGE